MTIGRVGFGVLVAVVLAAGLAHAATYTVTKTADTNDGACDADCSLRDAINAANARLGADEVVVPAGTYVLTIAGQLDIFGDGLTLTGAGAAGTIIDGNDHRVFEVHGETTVELSGVTIQGGWTDYGGGILNGGTLTLTNSTVSGNTAYVGGGGIFNTGTLTLTNSTVSGNTAYTPFPYAVGGGIMNFDTGTLTLTNSTVSGNTAALVGGGIFAIATLTNSAVATNSPDNCYGDPAASNGHNLDDDDTCGFADPTDLPGVNPLIGPLQDNGGPTETHALLPGSPAIDAGDDAVCPLTDQRGRPRADGDGDTVVTCDIGAFEFQPDDCGNGAMDGGEECDDGNRQDGDCCSSTCLLDPDGTACDDNDACTINDACGGGVCAGTAGPNGTPCDDQRDCTTADQCIHGVCEGVSISCGDGVVEGFCNEDCDDGPANGTFDSCCSSTCRFQSVLTGCDDNDVCTANSFCDGAGSCSVTIGCNEGVVCGGACLSQTCQLDGGSCVCGGP